MYAALLLHHANKEINEENLKKVLESAGIPVDDVRLKATVAALKEVNIEEAIKTAVPVGVAAAPAAVEAAPAEEKKEEKKEEEKKEEAVSEEEIEAGLSALFG